MSKKINTSKKGKKEIVELSFPTPIIRSCFTDDLKKAIIAFHVKESLEIWDIGKLKLTQAFPEAFAQISGIQFCADTTNFIISSISPNSDVWSISRWSEATGKQEQILECETRIDFMALSPDNVYIAYVTDQKYIHVYNQSSKETRTIEVQNPQQLQIIQQNYMTFFSRNKNQDEIYIWKIGTNAPLRTIKHPTIRSWFNLIVSPEQRLIIMYFEKFCVFDYSGRKCLEIPNPYIGRLANRITSNLKYLINENEDSIIVYNLSEVMHESDVQFVREKAEIDEELKVEEQLCVKFVKVTKPENHLTAYQKGPSGIIFGSANGAITIPRKQFYENFDKRHKEAVLAIEITKDSSGKDLLITASTSIKIWDLRDLSNFIFQFEKAHKEGVFDGDIWITALAMYPHKNLLASGSGAVKPRKNAVKIWDVQKRKPIGIFPGLHQDTIVALIPYGDSQLITASQDKFIFIVDVEKFTRLHVFEEAQLGTVQCIQLFSNYLVAGIGPKRNIKNAKVWEQRYPMPDELPQDQKREAGTDPHFNSIMFWNVVKMQFQFTFLRAHENTILDLAEGPNDLVLSCSTDRTIKIWNLKTKLLFRTLRHIEDKIPIIVSINYSGNDVEVISINYDKIGLLKTYWDPKVLDDPSSKAAVNRKYTGDRLQDENLITELKYQIRDLEVEVTTFKRELSKQKSSASIANQQAIESAPDDQSDIEALKEQRDFWKGESDKWKKKYNLQNSLSENVQVESSGRNSEVFNSHKISNESIQLMNKSQRGYTMGGSEPRTTILKKQNSNRKGSSDTEITQCSIEVWAEFQEALKYNYYVTKSETEMKNELITRAEQDLKATIKQQIDLSELRKSISGSKIAKNDYIVLFQDKSRDWMELAKQMIFLTLENSNLVHLLLQQPSKLLLDDAFYDAVCQYYYADIFESKQHNHGALKILLNLINLHTEEKDNFDHILAEESMTRQFINAILRKNNCTSAAEKILRRPLEQLSSRNLDLQETQKALEAMENPELKLTEEERELIKKKFKRFGEVPTFDIEFNDQQEQSVEIVDLSFSEIPAWTAINNKTIAEALLNMLKLYKIQLCNFVDGLFLSLRQIPTEIRCICREIYQSKSRNAQELKQSDHLKEVVYILINLWIEPALNSTENTENQYLKGNLRIILQLLEAAFKNKEFPEDDIRYELNATIQNLQPQITSFLMELAQIDSDYIDVIKQGYDLEDECKIKCQLITLPLQTIQQILTEIQNKEKDLTNVNNEIVDLANKLQQKFKDSNIGSEINDPESDKMISSENVYVSMHEMIYAGDAINDYIKEFITPEQISRDDSTSQRNLTMAKNLIKEFLLRIKDIGSIMDEQQCYEIRFKDIVKIYETVDALDNQEGDQILNQSKLDLQLLAQYILEVLHNLDSKFKANEYQGVLNETYSDFKRIADILDYWIPAAKYQLSKGVETLKNLKNKFEKDQIQTKESVEKKELEKQILKFVPNIIVEIKNDKLDYKEIEEQEELKEGETIFKGIKELFIDSKIVEAMSNFIIEGKDPQNVRAFISKLYSKQCTSDSDNKKLDKNKAMLLQEQLSRIVSFPDAPSEKDQRFYQKCLMIEWITFDHLKISSKYRQDTIWNSLSKKLQNLEKYATALEKVSVILKIIKNIEQIVEIASELGKQTKKRESIEAILAFIILKSKCKNIYSNINFINLVYDKQNLDNEDQLKFALFYMTVKAVEKADHKSTRMTEEEFKQLVDAKKAEYNLE